MGQGKRLVVGCLVAVMALANAGHGPARAAGFMEGDWIQNTGDLMQIALPVLGGGATFFTNPDPDRAWDREGTRQFVYAYSSAWTSTYVLKVLAAKARPNGDNRTSFPSGHTMSAFAGAGFIDGRYGRAWGIPALALAAFTGYSRVYSQWHYADDVLAGASIGLLYNWHFVTPQRGKVQLLPTVDRNGYGVQVTVGGGNHDEPEDTRPRGAAYHFGFGPAFLISNQVATRNGTAFELGDLNGHNDPTTTAAVTVGIPAGHRGDVKLSWGPFEARDEGSFQEEVVFGDMTVPAGTPVYSAWRFYDLRAQYEHAFIDCAKWRVTGGAGAGLSYSYAAIDLQDETDGELIQEHLLYPYLVAAVEYRFSDRWSCELYGDGIALNDDWIVDTMASITYRAGRAWDFVGGYKYFCRKIESDTMYNKVRYHVPVLGVSRYW